MGPMPGQMNPMLGALLQRMQGAGGTPAGPMPGNPGMPPIPGGNGAGPGIGAALAGPGGGGGPPLPMASPSPNSGPAPGGSPPGLMPGAIPPQAPMGGLPVSPTPPNPEPTGAPGGGQDLQRPVAGNQSLPSIARNPLGALLMGQSPIGQQSQALGGQQGASDPWAEVIRGMMNH